MFTRWTTCVFMFTIGLQVVHGIQDVHSVDFVRTGIFGSLNSGQWVQWIEAGPQSYWEYMEIQGLDSFDFADQLWTYEADGTIAHAGGWLRYNDAYGGYTIGQKHHATKFLIGGGLVYDVHNRNTVSTDCSTKDVPCPALGSTPAITTITHGAHFYDMIPFNATFELPFSYVCNGVSVDIGYDVMTGMPKFMTMWDGFLQCNPEPPSEPCDPVVHVKATPATMVLLLIFLLVVSVGSIFYIWKQRQTLVSKDSDVEQGDKDGGYASLE